MKHFITILLLAFSTISFTQQIDYNTKKGAVAAGYDVVTYFNNKAVKGEKKFSIKHNGATFRFSSEENLKAFKKSPKKYTPQYGGYCAYAIGAKGKKVAINPETFEIRDKKLYLFYNSGKTNTLELWINEGVEKLQQQADKNWNKIKFK